MLTLQEVAVHNTCRSRATKNLVLRCTSQEEICGSLFICRICSFNLHGLNWPNHTRQNTQYCWSWSIILGCWRYSWGKVAALLSTVFGVAPGFFPGLFPCGFLIALSPNLPQGKAFLYNRQNSGLWGKCPWKGNQYWADKGTDFQWKRGKTWNKQCREQCSPSASCSLWPGVSSVFTPPQWIHPRCLCDLFTSSVWIHILHHSHHLH